MSLGNDAPDLPSLADNVALIRVEGEEARKLLQRQTAANRPIQRTPWGTSAWTRQLEWDPTIGEDVTRWTQNIGLPEWSQAALDAQQRLTAKRSQQAEALINRVQQEYGAPVRWTNLPYLATPEPGFDLGGWGQDPLGYRIARHSAVTSRNRPEMSQERLAAGEIWQRPLSPTNVPGEAWEGLAPTEVSLGRPAPLDPNQVDIESWDALRPNEISAFGWGQMDPNEIQQSYYQRMAPSELESPEEFRDRAEEAVYERMTSRLDPQWQQMEEALQSQLWNQGLRPGDEAYDEAVDDFNRRRTDAYQAAQNEAVLAGRAEAESQFGMGLSRRQQAIQEAQGQFAQDVARREIALGERERVQGAEMARRELAGTEFGRQVEREMARRELMGAEYGQRFGEEMAQRQLAGQEYESEFSREMERRQQEVDERTREFESALAARQTMTQEVQDVFNRELARRQQGEAEFGADFAREAQYAGLSMQEARDLFNRELARRQQVGSEIEQRFGQQLTQRQQGIVEELQRRGVSLNEINALLSGQQVATPSMPSFIPAGREPTPNLTGAAAQQYRAELDAYNAEQMRDQGIFAGLTGLTGAGASLAAAFGFSDRRLKTHIRRVGTLLNGIPVYSYKIFGMPTIGVMADEVPKEWTAVHPSGFLMVDYSKVWTDG